MDDQAVDFGDYLRELADPRQPVVISRLTHLSNLGPDQAASFLDVWYELDVRRRLEIIQELVDLAEDNVELNFDPVFQIALADRDADVRRHAIRGLWEYEGRDLIDSLIGLMQTDPDAAVRAEAALSLGRFVMKAEFGDLRAPDVERLEENLREVAERESEVVEVRARALESLGARSEPWVSDLIDRGYESEDRRLRISAVHAMGRSCDAQWLPKIALEVEDDDPEMRFEAATALGEIADEGGVPYLLPLLHDEDEEVQEAAIQALGEIGGQTAREALEDLLQDADERVQEAVTEALAEVEFIEDPLTFRVD